MKSLFLAVLALSPMIVQSAELQTRIEITTKKPAGTALKWQADVPPVVGAQAEYSLHSSSNLANWSVTGEPVKVGDNGAVEIPLAADGGPRFFRLERKVAFGEPVDPGAEAAGFSGSYKAELQRLGQ